MHMNNDEKIQMLRKNNPFLSSSVGDPRDNRYPDIAAVNEPAFLGLSQLIRQKTASPALPCAGLVFGETGSGKTHLISRLLRTTGTPENGFSFAYLQPIEDPEQTYRYLLREIIVNLCHPAQGFSSETRMDFLLNRIFQDAENMLIRQKISAEKQTCEEPLFDEFRDRLRQTAGTRKKISPSFFREIGKLIRIVFDVILKPAPVCDPQKNIKKDAEIREKRDLPDALAFVQSKFPDIPGSFLKVLFQYRDPGKRSAALEWLKGEDTDEKDMACPGIPGRTHGSGPMQEEQSRKILESLGLLLMHYGNPLIVCFDRLENYDTDQKIRSLGTMIEFLVDQAKAMLPVVFVRGDAWNELFSRKLNDHIVTRLETNEFNLKGCDCHQSLELIRTRLSRVLGENGNENFFPFDREELIRIFQKKLFSPREVIISANRCLQKILYPDLPLPEPPGSADTLKKAFASQYRAVRTEFGRHVPDRGRLRHALELCLRCVSLDAESFIENLSSPEDKYIDFVCKVRHSDALPNASAENSHFPAAFIIDVEKSGQAVVAAFRRGCDFLKENPLARVLYIRDARCEIPAPPQWKATNEMMDLFRKSGGRILLLDEKDAAAWYALTFISYAVKDGDIMVPEPGDRFRNVSKEEFAAFIRKEILANPDAGFGPVTAIWNNTNSPLNIYL